MELVAELPSRTLVLGLVRLDGRLHAGEAYDLAAELGLTDQQVRLCLRRLVAAGTLVAEGGRGRAGVFRFTGPRDADPLPESEFLQLAYDQDEGRAPWDGRWRLVSFSVPESTRSVRDSLRAYVQYLGGAPLDGGLYVSPHDWAQTLRTYARTLDAEPYLTLATCVDLAVHGEHRPRAVATRLWDLEAIAAGYAGFVTAAGAAPPAASSALARLFALVVGFARVAADDPLLPNELLPAAWPGTLARTLLREQVEPLADELARQDRSGNPLRLLTDLETAGRR